MTSQSFHYLPEKPEPPKPVSYAKSGHSFGIPAQIADPGTDLHSRFVDWLARYDALPSNLRADVPPPEELMRCENIVTVRDAVYQQTFENFQVNLALQEELVTLLDELEAVHTQKRGELLATRNVASENLAALIGPRIGLTPVTVPHISNIEMTLNGMSSFMRQRTIYDARRGDFVADAKDKLLNFLKVITA